MEKHENQRASLIRIAIAITKMSFCVDFFFSNYYFIDFFYVYSHNNLIVNQNNSGTNWRQENKENHKEINDLHHDPVVVVYTAPLTFCENQM